MAQHLFWLAFMGIKDNTLRPYWAESRQQALDPGIEHVMNQKPAAEFTKELGFDEEQRLELAQVLPPPASLLMRAPQEE